MILFTLSLTNGNVNNLYILKLLGKTGERLTHTKSIDSNSWGEWERCYPKKVEKGGS